MNKKTVKITGYPDRFLTMIDGSASSKAYQDKQLDNELRLIIRMRTARKVGDVETINHTMLGKLRDSQIKFETLK